MSLMRIAHGSVAGCLKQGCQYHSLLVAVSSRSRSSKVGVVMDLFLSKPAKALLFRFKPLQAY